MEVKQRKLVFMMISVALLLLIGGYQYLLKRPLQAWRLQNQGYQQQLATYQQAKAAAKNLPMLHQQLKSYRKTQPLTAVELARLARNFNCQLQQSTADKQVFVGQFQPILHLLAALPTASSAQVIINSQGVDSQLLKLMIINQEK